MENKSNCDVDIKKRFECNNSRISSQFVDVKITINDVIQRSVPET